MSSLIKICGLSSAPTLDAALAAGADMVGFVFFARSPRHVGLDQARMLAARARGRARIVALAVDAADDALAAIVAALAPDLLQLHGKEAPARVAEIRRKFALPVIKAIGVAAAADLAPVGDYAGVADWLLFDAKAPKDAKLPGGNGVAFDWRLLGGLGVTTPWLLSGGLDAGNVADAIGLTGARGVDVSSGVERAPGVKDIEKIDAFAAAARAGFARLDALASRRSA